MKLDLECGCWWGGTEALSDSVAGRCDEAAVSPRERGGRVKPAEWGVRSAPRTRMRWRGPR